jgi:cell wall-associated NlpC family hydrolase/peptidoglycan hydrolase CwlO-like protein
VPPRVNLTVLVGFVVVIVLSFGLSAGAQPGDGTQGDDTLGVEPGEGSVDAGSVDGEIGEAQRELERLRWEVQSAHGARLNAEEEQHQAADDIADTQTELAAAKERSADARNDLADTASEVYRNRGLGDLLGVLVGAGTFRDFADRLDLAARLLTQKQTVLEEASETEEKLAGELQERQEHLQRWETTGAEKETVEERVRQAEGEVQAYLDSLDQGVREGIEAERAQQAQLDQTRGEEILRKLEEEESAAVVPAQDLPPAQNATEKLGELRNVEQEVEERAVEKVVEAEQARIAAEPTGEPRSEAEPKATEPQAGPQRALQVERAGLEGSERPATEAERAVTEAEQAATEAAKQAEAAEQARRVAERDAAAKAAANAAADRANLQEEATKKAEERRAELPIQVSNDTDGSVNGGDRLRVEGDFAIKPGATVTFRDADGTTGMAIDGLNANIVEGSIDTTMTAPLENVGGGDGILDTTGPLDVVGTTGIDTGLGTEPLPQDAVGAAGLQPDPLAGAAGLQPDPTIGATGLQPELPAVSGQPGLQPELPAVSGQPGLQPASPALATGGPASGSGLVREAMSWLGAPYSYGGTSRGGISCSGLVMMVYGKFGISLPNSPGGQLDVVGPLKSGPAPAGAIVFFTEDGSGSPTHVGISNGNGTMTDANVVKGQVGITPIDIVTGYMGWGFPPGF